MLIRTRAIDINGTAMTHTSKSTLASLQQLGTKIAIDEGIGMLERRQKFKLADRSEYGWRTVEEDAEDDLVRQ